MTSEPSKEVKAQNDSEGRRMAFCAVGGVGGGVAVLAASLAIRQALHFCFANFPAAGIMPHGSPVDHFIYPLREHLLFTCVWAFIGGIASALVPRRMQSPLPLAVLWASLLGSLGLLASIQVVTYDRDMHPTERIAIVVFFVGVGAAYGFVAGLIIRVLEIIRARLTPPPVPPEPPR